MNSTRLQGACYWISTLLRVLLACIYKYIQDSDEIALQKIQDSVEIALNYNASFTPSEMGCER